MKPGTRHRAFTVMELLIAVSLLALLVVTAFRFSRRNLKIDEDLFRANQQKDMQLALKRISDDLRRASNMVKLKKKDFEVVRECPFMYAGEAVVPETGQSKPLYLFSICHPYSVDSLTEPAPSNLVDGRGNQLLVAAVLTGRETRPGQVVGQIDYVRTLSYDHDIFDCFPVPPAAPDPDFVDGPLPPHAEVEMRGARPLLKYVRRIHLHAVEAQQTIIGISLECSPTANAPAERVILREHLSVPVNVSTGTF